MIIANHTSDAGIDINRISGDRNVNVLRAGYPGECSCCPHLIEVGDAVAHVYVQGDAGGRAHLECAKRATSRGML